MSTFTPFLFLRRGRVWTIVFPGPDEKKKQRSTRLRGRENEAKARKVLAVFIQRRQAASVIGGGKDSGPMTVARWAPLWLATRRAKGISSVGEYESQLRHHVLPAIGAMRVEAITAEHIVQVMAALAAKERAPKTRRNVYFTMHAMFAKAVGRGLLEKNPCSIDDEELPRKMDADPEWRATAIFAREEVANILGDPRVPFDRQVFYAVMFLAGPRFGEVSALHVRHYLPALAPLGQLQVARSYNSKSKRLKSTKSGKPRKVPVHPALRWYLDEWLRRGFAQFVGRQPLPDDPLIPARWWQTRTMPAGGPPGPLRQRPYHTMFKRFLADLETLGLRRRRQHDARRTFISLCRADGARKDILRLVTHGPEGDIMDIYSEIPWGTLCEEVAKLEMPVPGSGNPPESLESGLPLGCHPVFLQRNPNVGSWAQQGSKTDTPPEQAPSSESNDRQLADDADLATGCVLSPEDVDGQVVSMATVATHALRAALAALDRGRLDEARSILERAIEAERAGEPPAEGTGS